MVAILESETIHSGSAGLSAAAKEAFREAEGDMKETQRLLKLMIRANEELLEELIDTGVYDLAIKVRIQERKSIIRQSLNRRASQGRPAGTDTSARHLHAVADDRNLYTMPLPYMGDKQIGDALMGDLHTCIREVNRAMVADQTTKLWLGLVVKKMKPGKMVRECVSVNELASLRQAAQDVVFRDANKVD